MHTAHVAEDGPVDLPKRLILGKRWRILHKLGEGGCGSVYKVEDIKTKAKAALKAESNYVDGGSVLKLEVKILKRLEGRHHVAQLLHSRKKAHYSYMVMTLFGQSLNRLLRHLRPDVSISTQVRVGINILYGLKQLHEVGFIHRDVKPANLAVGRYGAEAHIVHMLDFGLSREYIMRNRQGKYELRRARRNTLFRGTIRYCSANTHSRNEQGRPDDLWSMIYVLAEMRDTLPWDGVREKNEIGRIKKKTKDTDLLGKSPKQLVEISAHLRTLTYYTRPDYKYIYKKFHEVMIERNYSYSDPLDWENPEHLPHKRKATLQKSQNGKEKMNSRLLKKRNDNERFNTHETLDLRTDKTKDDSSTLLGSTGKKKRTNKVKDIISVQTEDTFRSENEKIEQVFSTQDFSSNELGF